MTTTSFVAAVREFADGSFVIQSVVDSRFWLAYRGLGDPLREPPPADGSKARKLAFWGPDEATAALRVEGFARDQQPGESS